MNFSNRKWKIDRYSTNAKQTWNRMPERIAFIGSISVSLRGGGLCTDDHGWKKQIHTVPTYYSIVGNNESASYTWNWHRFLQTVEKILSTNRWKCNQIIAAIRRCRHIILMTNSLICETLKCLDDWISIAIKMKLIFLFCVTVLFVLCHSQRISERSKNNFVRKIVKKS